MTILLTLVLGLIAAVHFAWGMRIWIPIRDEAQLARTVVGAKGVDRMPGTIPCMLVVAGFAASIVALWMRDMALARFVLWTAAVVFFARGAIAYTKVWRSMTPEEPFNTYDQRYYAPLCFAIGAGLLIILLGG